MIRTMAWQFIEAMAGRTKAADNASREPAVRRRLTIGSTDSAPIGLDTPLITSAGGHIRIAAGKIEIQHLGEANIRTRIRSNDFQPPNTRKPCKKEMARAGAVGAATVFLSA